MFLSEEVELLKKMKAGDQQAFTMLFQYHWKQLYNIALSKTGEDHTAQDIVQELFLHLWEQRDKLEVQGPLSNYLYGILRNRIFDHYRTTKKQALQLEQLSILISSDEAAPMPQEALQQRAEREQRFDAAVRNLPARIRQVYQLRSQERYSFIDIASMLKIRPQTARNAYFRAKELLKQNSSYTIPVLYLLLNNLFIQEGQYKKTIPTPYFQKAITTSEKRECQYSTDAATIAEIPGWTMHRSGSTSFTSMV